MRYRTFVVVALTMLAAGSAYPAVDLPDPAREQIDSGLAAAVNGDWVTAVERLSVARKLAPRSSFIYYNLGLMEAQIPGRELRSIAWFEAYLSLEPAAADASAVREQIAELKGQIRDKLAELTAILVKSGGKGNDLERACVAMAQAWIGDIAGARRTASGIGEKRDAVLKNVAEIERQGQDSISGNRGVSAWMNFVDGRLSAPVFTRYDDYLRAQSARTAPGAFASYVCGVVRALSQSFRLIVGRQPIPSKEVGLEIGLDPKDLTKGPRW